MTSRLVLVFGRWKMWSVWFSHRLHSVKLLLETSQLAADTDDVAASASLEGLADQTLFLTIWTRVRQLLLALVQSQHHRVEHLFYVC